MNLVFVDLFLLSRSHDHKSMYRLKKSGQPTCELQIGGRFCIVMRPTNYVGRLIVFKDATAKLDILVN